MLESGFTGLGPKPRKELIRRMPGAESGSHPAFAWSLRFETGWSRLRAVPTQLAVPDERINSRERSANSPDSQCARRHGSEIFPQCRESFRCEGRPRLQCRIARVR